MLWRTYALLSHGRDRLGLGSIGFPSGHWPGVPSFRRSGDVLKVLEEIDRAIWSASALSACAESGLLTHLGKPTRIDDLAQAASLPPVLARILIDVLASHGFVTWEQDRIRATAAFMPFTTSEGAVTFRASLRAPLLQTDSFRRKLADGSLTLDGWTHMDEAIIEAQGSLTRLWTARALPKLKLLPGLVARLKRPGASLLDVGAGAAGLSITLCNHFPHLSAVALEPAPYPAAVGDRQVEEAGLAARIVVRRERVEDLRQEQAFDLAFLPQMFLPDTVIQEALERIYCSLRPGGWLLVAVLSQEGHGKNSAINRLKNLLWGGSLRDVNHLRPRLAAAGFDPVIRALGGHSLRMICARRPNLRDLA